MGKVDSEHMFDPPSLVGTRERAAVLALMARRRVQWNRLAGSIEEAGSALTLLEEMEAAGDPRLFPVEGSKLSLDQLEERVIEYEKEGIDLVTVLDSEYPSNLRMVHDRPPVLFVRGELSARDERSAAVVGSRKASPEGREKAAEIARDLVAGDYVVFSGLAAGIDTAAHEATLAAGGRTIGVIGTGLRHYFPKQNAALQDRLAEESAILSQFWPGQEPRRWTFPQRNAVMSGLARATIVVEAGNKSGARMQARLAIEHGRPVFLLRSLLRHEWAQTYADERPATYVVDGGQEIVEHLERLYSQDFALSA
jgi:DNA processing protein